MRGCGVCRAAPANSANGAGRRCRRTACPPAGARPSRRLSRPAAGPAASAAASGATPSPRLRCAASNRPSAGCHPRLDRAAVELPREAVDAREQLARAHDERLVRRVWHSAVVASRKDGVGRQRLAGQRGDPDPVGFVLHCRDVWHALRRLGALAELRLLLDSESGINFCRLLTVI